MEDAVAIYCEDCDGNLLVKCKVCVMCLNGPTQWEDHKIGKKHRKHLKAKPEKRSAKVIVPTGAAIIIEQTAIYNAVETIDEAWIAIESVDKESSDKEFETWIVM